MPNIYLSPSLQPYNEYVNGGSEQYHMNILADNMERTCAPMESALREIRLA